MQPKEVGNDGVIGTVQFKIPDDPSLRDQIEQIKGKRYESNEALHDVRTLEGSAGIRIKRPWLLWAGEG
jgi:hypothetical protein